MWTETPTFDVDNATKNYKKILDLSPCKGGQGCIMIRRKLKLYNICHMHIHYIHVISIHFGAPPPLIIYYVYGPYDNYLSKF